MKHKQPRRKPDINELVLLLACVGAAVLAVLNVWVTR